MTRSKTKSRSALIEAASKECFVNDSKVPVTLFITALQKRNIVTRNKLAQIVQSTDYLVLMDNNNTVVLTRNIFPAKATNPPCPPPPKNTAPKPVKKKAVPPAVTKSVDVQVLNSTKTGPSPVADLAASKIANTRKSVPPLSINCDTTAIVDILDDIATCYLDLGDTRMTDIFLDVGSNLSAKINAKCVQLDRIISHSDVSTILEHLPGYGPDFRQSNRVIFGQTLHRLATVRYNGTVTGITIRIGRSVSGLLPVFEGLVEQKNVLLCGSPNVGKTTTLREICKYLSRGKCLCLIDTSGEVCGEAGNRGHIVGTSRVFRPVDPAKQYATLLDCVRNHSPDVIAIDELHTKDEVEVCQTIALRSIQMVASVHGNIQDLVFNPMLNKALGGSTQALVSDRVAIDGRKVVMQRTTRPIFEVVINITRTSQGLEYSFIEDVANNVSRIMQGKPIHIRRRRIVGEELLESKEEVLYPCDL